MSTLRLWIAVLVGVSFTAGLAGGLLLARRLEAPAPVPGRFGDYERMLVSRFELDTERGRLASQLLRNYEREIEDVQVRHLASYVSAMEPELERLGARYHGYIRDKVLPQEQREEFDHLCLPVSLAN